MADRFEFVPGDEIVIAPGRTVKRIRALVAIAEFGVVPGDVGGYVEKKTNLSGNAWVYGDARVSGDAQVYGNAQVYGDAQVSGNAQVSRNPLVLSGLRWTVTITDLHMQIGCQLHSLAEWAAFDDSTIVAMDGRDALRFWRAHKHTLLALSAADGRGVAEQPAEAA